MKTANFSHVIPLRDLMTQEVNTLHIFTAGGYRHLLKWPSTLLMRAQTQLIWTLAGPILDLGDPTPACSEDRSLIETLSYPLPYQMSSIHLSTPGCRNFGNCDWVLTKEECRLNTAQSTPWFSNSGGMPMTPAKSVCVERASSSSTPVFLIIHGKYAVFQGESSVP